MPAHALGYNTNGFAHHRLDDATRIIAAMGYQTIALTLDVHHLDPYTTPPDEVDRYRELLDGLHLNCVIETGARFLLDPHKKHFPTLVSRYQHERDTRRGFLERTIRTASQLGAHVVSFWSGAHDPTMQYETVLAQLAEECRRLADYAAQRGVVIAFEPEPGMFIDTMPKFAELFAAVNHPAFGLTLDVGHLICQRELPVSAFVQAWQRVLWNIHLDDMKPGVHDHLQFGEGEVDFAEFFAALGAIDFRGSATVELSRHSYNAVETAQRAYNFLKPFSPDR